MKTAYEFNFLSNIKEISSVAVNMPLGPAMSPVTVIAQVLNARRIHRHYCVSLL